jgi:hypothetical protein
LLLRKSNWAFEVLPEAPGSAAKSNEVAPGRAGSPAVRPKVKKVVVAPTKQPPRPKKGGVKKLAAAGVEQDNDADSAEVEKPALADPLAWLREEYAPRVATAAELTAVEALEAEEAAQRRDSFDPQGGQDDDYDYSATAAAQRTDHRWGSVSAHLAGTAGSAGSSRRASLSSAFGNEGAHACLGSSPHLGTSLDLGAHQRAPGAL